MQFRKNNTLVRGYMWIKNNFFKYSIGIILVLLIIFLLGQVDFFLAPFKKFIAVLFIPVLISLLLYYLMRPLVRLAIKFKFPPVLAILSVFVVFILVFSLIGTYAGSIIVDQFNLLIDDLPHITETVKEKAQKLVENENFASLFTGKIQEQFTTYAQKAFPVVKDNILGAISAVTGIASVLLTVPFMVFYLLKDDRIFYRRLSNVIHRKYRREITDIIKETDKTLSTYVIGQAIIALILGTLTFIGYLIIGLKYSFILAFFVMITSFIPMFGTIIGVVPALLLGIAVNPFMAVKVLIVAVIVQQIEGNFVSPNVIGKRLDIHPLTVIIIFLGAAALYGFIGMLIAVPFYAVIKVLATGGLRIFRIWRHGRVRREV